MNKSMQFVLSQILTVFLVALLMINQDFLEYSTGAPLIIFAALALFISLNGIIWFGDDLIAHLRRLFSDEAIGKIKRKRAGVNIYEDEYGTASRLQDGTIDDGILYEHMVGDDGELIQLNRGD